MGDSFASRLGEEAAELMKQACYPGCRQAHPHRQARPHSHTVKTPGKLSTEAHKALSGGHGSNQTPYRYGRTMKDRPAPEARK